MKKLAYLALASGAMFALSCQQKPGEQPTQQAQPQEQAQQPAQQTTTQAEQKPAEQPKAEEKPAQQEAQAPAGQQVAQAKDMQAFAQQKGCFACHDINNKKVGPAFKEVAKRFAGQPSIEEELAKRIKNGGVGKWGQVPMPPQNVTEQEAKDLAKWVLSLK